jgi:hypothetical protein
LEKPRILNGVVTVILAAFYTGGFSALRGGDEARGDNLTGSMIHMSDSKHLHVIVIIHVRQMIQMITSIYLTCIPSSRRMGGKNPGLISRIMLVS